MLDYKIVYNIRELRIKLGLIGVEFAAALGVHVSTVSNWETHRRYPVQDMIDKIIELANQNGYDIHVNSLRRRKPSSRRIKKS